MFRLVRTDSHMINPNETNEYYDSNFRVGEVIMSPRKKKSIISALNKEFKTKYSKQ